jgi:hypothetical protein
MSRIITPIPFIALKAQDRGGSGIVLGNTGSIDTTEITKKKIWKEAERRAIESTRANRKLAYKIDGLVRAIANIKRFSILKSYKLTAVDEVASDDLKTQIDLFIKKTDMLRVFRQSFTPLEIEGACYIQKQYSGAELESLVALEDLEKHTKPTDASDYYYFQDMLIPKEWRDPTCSETDRQRVWFIDEDIRDQYKEIKDPPDKVLARDRIIEVLNNDSGESDLQPVVSLVFIKNFLLQLLPNLIEVVTSPQEEIIYSTIDKAGVACVPTMPPASLKTADNTKYLEEKKYYEEWKSSLTELVNRIATDRLEMRKTIHPDTVEEKVLESNASLNGDLIRSLVDVLDTQISFGMGFSLSLISASGVELATSQTIFQTVAVTMRGVQEQYKTIANALIYERFPEAEAAGIDFVLSELNPEDETNVSVRKKTDAERKKLYAEVAEILFNMGMPEESIKTFVSDQLNVDLEGAGSLSIQAAATDVVSVLTDYQEHLMEEADE